MTVGWNEINVNSWRRLSDALEEVLDGYRDPPTYLFRGQADASWSLRPSLTRRLEHVEDRAAAHDIEHHLEAQFKAQAALFPETQSVLPFLFAAGRTEAWAFMQHHNCATRLLDWTASAYVGAYFSVHEYPDKPGALYVVAPEALSQHAEQTGLGRTFSDEDLVNPELRDRVTFTYPNLGPLRLVSQQGHFSVGSNILEPHDGPILAACRVSEAQQPRRVISRKIVIESALKLIVLQQLRAMNVAPHALFPGLDGLGRSLSDLATLKAILSRKPANIQTQPPT